MTLGVLCFTGGVAWFVHLLRGVLADGKVVTADHCLHNTDAPSCLPPRRIDHLADAWLGA